MKLELNILPNTPDRNGRVYPEDVLDVAFKKFLDDKTPAYVTLGPPDQSMFDMRTIIGVCEAIDKVDGRYIADVRILINRIPEDVLKVLKLHTLGIGEVTTGVVTSFSLRCLYVDNR